MAAPIEFLSARDRARLARTQGVVTPNGDTYRNGVIVTRQDANRSAATRARNDFLAEAADRQSIQGVVPISTTPITASTGIVTTPISNIAAPAGISLYDNRAIGQIRNYNPATGTVVPAATPALAPDAPVTRSQVQQAAQALRAVNGMIGDRVYTDAAIARATPAQIVAEAGTLETRLAIERARKEEAARLAQVSAAAAVAGAGVTGNVSTPLNPTFTPAPISQPANIVTVDGQIQPATPAGTVTVDGQVVPQLPTGTASVDGRVVSPSNSLVALGAGEVPLLPEATFSVPTTGDTPAATATGSARQRALTAIAGGGLNTAQAQALLQQADAIDDPNGLVAAQSRLDLENNNLLVRRGLEQTYFNTPEGQAELAVRQKQVDQIASQLTGAQTQLDTKLAAVDARYSAYIREKVESARAAVTDQKLLAQLNNLGPQAQLELLASQGYVSEGDADKARLKEIGSAREAAQREYQTNVQTLQRLGSELVQSNPRLNFSPFGTQAPSDVTSAPAASGPASPFGAAAPVAAQAETPFTAAATASPTPAAPVASVDAQLSQAFFDLGQPGANVRAIGQRIEALQAQKAAFEAEDARRASALRNVAAEQAAARARFDALSSGQAGVSAPLL